MNDTRLTRIAMILGLVAGVLALAGGLRRVPCCGEIAWVPTIFGLMLFCLALGAWSRLRGARG